MEVDSGERPRRVQGLENLAWGADAVGEAAVELLEVSIEVRKTFVNKFEMGLMKGRRGKLSRSINVKNAEWDVAGAVKSGCMQRDVVLQAGVTADPYDMHMECEKGSQR